MPKAGTILDRFNLLCVDDNPDFAAMIESIFRANDYVIYTALNGLDALELMKEVRIDVALVDYMMPKMDGLSLLKVIRDEYPETMVIMVTGHGGIQEAIQAIRLGAIDFMEKPFTVEAIRSRIANLYQIWHLRDENRRLKEKVRQKFGYEQLVGNSAVMLKLKDRISLVGASDASVLVEGETGTGKELVARAIHHHSPRALNVFMPVDCAAITETVIESELFGHVKGAFTGAHSSTPGLIRSAHGGTLFLDEIGELSQAMQVKLLRTIQEREVRPVGSTKSFPVDVRIVAATNKNLGLEVEKGRFREDLLYRLNVVSITVPPLRDRKEDIPLLARFFVKDFSTSFSSVKDISREAIECLMGYAWPGNVRELANVIRQAAALGEGDRILPGDLPESMCGESMMERKSTKPEDATMASYEKAAILNALSLSGGNRKKAAGILGIGEATLYRKISAYRI